VAGGGNGPPVDSPTGRAAHLSGQVEDRAARQGGVFPHENERLELAERVVDRVPAWILEARERTERLISGVVDAGYRGREAVSCRC
jgi:hypothetical protein